MSEVAGRRILALGKLFDLQYVPRSVLTDQGGRARLVILLGRAGHHDRDAGSDENLRDDTPVIRERDPLILPCVRNRAYQRQETARGLLVSDVTNSALALAAVMDIGHNDSSSVDPTLRQVGDKSTVEDSPDTSGRNSSRRGVSAGGAL